MHMTDAANAVNAELAMLQQRVNDGTATRGMKSRLERLKKQQERESLGRLFKLFDAYEFRDGALFRVRLRRSRGVAAYVAEPQWSTVQVLDLNGHLLDGVPSAEFINSLPALHTLQGLSLRVMPRSPCPRITALGVTSDCAPEVLAATFPSLRTLSVEYLHDAQRFWSNEFIRALERVTICPLTWTADTLRVNEMFGLEEYVESIDFGPPLKRLELLEDVLLEGGDLYRMGPALAAARRKGAEVIVVPGEPQPPPRFLY
jgi:hypothetical protein